MRTKLTSKNDTIYAPIVVELPEPDREFNSRELWLTLPGAKTLLKQLVKAILEEERKTG